MRRFLPDSAGTWWFVFFILLYFGAASWLVVHLPAHATPNELLNFEYIQVMRQIRGLPNRGLVDSEIRYTEWHQPPLYFAFATLTGLGIPVPESTVNPPPPIAWPANPAYLSTHRGNLNPVVHITPQNAPLLYTSRLAAAFLGILGLAALYRAGRAVYCASVALLMVSLLAFQPNYLHLSASVNNDMPLTAVAAMVLAYTILIIHNERAPRWFFGLGLLAAAAILTKANGVFVLAYLGAAWLAVQLRYHEWPRTIKSALYSLAGLIPLWAAWLLLNTMRMKDTLGVAGSLPVDRVLALRPADFALLLPWMDNIWRSFWLDWSAGDVGFGPDWYYVLWAILLGIALLGWLRRPPQRGTWPILLTVLLGMAAISYLYFAVKALTIKEAGFMVTEGRWWLPVMPALAWLAAAGFARWWPPPRREQALLLAAFVPLVSAYMLLWFFYPTLYPQAEKLPSRAEVDAPTAVIYAERLALIEAAIDPLTANKESELILTWQAVEDLDEDLVVAVQLLNTGSEAWQKLDEQHSFPGLGLNPTGGWRAGDVYRDRWALRPRDGANGPLLAQLLIHVQQEGDNLDAAVDGRPLDPPILLSVPLRPEEPLQAGSPLPQPVNFGGIIELQGVQTERDGEKLSVTLWWNTLKAPEKDYAIFLHLVDDQGNLLAQDDGMPAGGTSPTHIWQEGDVVRDRHHLQESTEGQSVHVGVYDPAGGQRLPASISGQPMADGAFKFPLLP